MSPCQLICISRWNCKLFRCGVAVFLATKMGSISSTAWADWFPNFGQPCLLHVVRSGAAWEFQGAGAWRRGTLVIFPISNELAITGAFEAYEEEKDASASAIAKINGTIALHAGRQIYARDSSFIYQMAHNEKIMRGDEFLADQESL